MAEALRHFPHRSRPIARVAVALGRIPIRSCRMLALALALVCPRLHAHRLDELLQATLIHIDRTEVRLDCELTPGVQVARHVLESLDLNRDGVISNLESLAYTEIFQRQVVVRLDDSPLQLSTIDVHIPALPELTNGSASIQLELTGTYPPLAPGPHRLHFENHHQTNRSVYLANALLPDDRSIEISRQSRDEFQRTNLIEFTVNPGATTPQNPPPPDSSQPPNWGVWLAVATGTTLVIPFLAKSLRRRPNRSDTEATNAISRTR